MRGLIRLDFPAGSVGKRTKGKDEFSGRDVLVLTWVPMNLLIGFVILICLVCSEIQTTEVASDLWLRLLTVGLVSLTVPGLALFQTLVVTQRFKNSQLSDAERESTLRRLSVCHSAVWLTASLAIIWAVRWQDIVRGNWNLDRWPLLDEILIVAPVLLSLLASWAIFFEIQCSTIATPKLFDLARLKSRIEFVSIRFRVYCLMVLIPISIAILRVIWLPGSSR